MIRFSWNRFWFEEQVIDNLGLLRIGLGLVLLMKLTGATSPLVKGELTIEIPKFTFPTESGYFLHGFHLPISGFDWVPSPGYFGFGVLDLVILTLAFAFTLGICLRWTGPLLALLFSYFFIQSQFFYHHHLYFLVVALLVVCRSPGLRSFSVDSYLETGFVSPTNSQCCPVTPIRMMQLLVTFVYLFGALAKLNWGWVSGEVIEVLKVEGRVRGPIGGFFLSLIPVWVVGCGTILTELFLAFGFWNPKTRKWCFLLGIALHLGIDSAIEVETFGLTMMAAYIAFIGSKSQANLVVYNADSNREVKLVRLLKLLDWLHRFRFQSHTEFEATWQGVSPRVAENINSRSILEKLPLTFVPALLWNFFLNLKRHKS